MKFGAIGHALHILGVLESLDTQEWGLGAENECVWQGSPALALF